MVFVGKHVGLDAQLLSPREDYRAAGCSHYVYHLLSHLPRSNGAFRYTAYLPFHCAGLPEAIRQVIASLPTGRPPVRILWEQCIVPAIVLRQRVDLWHALVNVVPLLLPKPAVVTIQDLTFLRCPDHFPASKRLYNRVFVHLSARRARQIIVTSQSTKEDIIRYWHIPPSKITVTHLGVDRSFQPLPDRAALEAFRRQKGLPEHTILFIGTIEPRKNLARLAEAFAILKQKGKIPHRLIIGGGKGWLYHDVFATVQELGMVDHVHFPGFIPQDELALWYNSADLFVYPSLYEGFGLPPLEAMACGTPVVVSNTSSLPEVVGEAALHVDPYDVKDLAEAMHRLLLDRALHATMREAGLQRARTFSWEKTARETIRVYQQALGCSEEKLSHV